MQPAGLLFWVCIVLFNLTGLTNSTIGNELDLVGLTLIQNGLQVLAAYIGVLVGALFLKGGWRTLTRRQLVSMIPIVILDVVGNVIYWWGMYLIGSGLTTVIYTSIVAFSAGFQYLLFGKRLSWSKLVAAVGVIGFIALCSVDEVQNTAVGSKGAMILGILLSAAAAVGYGFEFVLENYLIERYERENAIAGTASVDLSDGDSGGPRETGTDADVLAWEPGLDAVAEQGPHSGVEADRPMTRNKFIDAMFLPISDQHLCIGMAMGIVPTLLYVLCYTVPFRQKVIYDPVHNASAKGHDNWSYVWGLYAGFCLSNGLHNISLYFCVGAGHIAAITASVNKGLQAAMVFVASSVLFCNVQPSQCMTTKKIIGVTGVFLSVLLYALGDIIFKQKQYDPASDGLMVNKSWEYSTAVANDPDAKTGAEGTRSGRVTSQSWG